MALSNDKIGRYCGVQSAAIILDVHPKTIYRWAKSGKIPSERVHGKIVMDMKKLLKIKNKVG